MNWLDSVLSQVVVSSLSDEDKARLMIRAVDLSDICDKWAPQATAPEVYFDDGWCHVGWWIPNQLRLLALWTHSDTATVTLKLQHGSAESEVDSPSFTVMQGAARSFFDKWSSP